MSLSNALAGTRWCRARRTKCWSTCWTRDWSDTSATIRSWTTSCWRTSSSCRCRCWSPSWPIYILSVQCHSHTRIATHTHHNHFCKVFLNRIGARGPIRTPHVPQLHRSAQRADAGGQRVRAELPQKRRAVRAPLGGCRATRRIRGSGDRRFHWGRLRVLAWWRISLAHSANAYRMCIAFRCGWQRMFANGAQLNWFDERRNYKYIIVPFQSTCCSAPEMHTIAGWLIVVVVNAFHDK